MPQPTAASDRTFVYRHARLGILTERTADVVDLTDGLRRMLDDAPLGSGILNLRSFGEGTGIVVAMADAIPAAAPGAMPDGACLPIVDGHLQLGARERVLLIDNRGPAAREVAIVIIGERRR